MIEHNSEVYNHPYISYLFSLYMYIWKKISVGVIVYFTVMFDHPSCFLTFCRSCIPTSCYCNICNVFYYYFVYTYMYNEKRYVGVIVYFTVMFDHPSCFLRQVTSDTLGCSLATPKLASFPGPRRLGPGNEASLGVAISL